MARRPIVLTEFLYPKTSARWAFESDRDATSSGWTAVEEVRLGGGADGAECARACAWLLQRRRAAGGKRRRHWAQSAAVSLAFFSLRSFCRLTVRPSPSDCSHACTRTLLQHSSLLQLLGVRCFLCRRSSPTTSLCTDREWPCG